MTDVAARLARLEAIEAIRALKARYAALADAKYRPDHRRVAPAEWRRIALLQAACFCEDAMWEAGSRFGGTRHGRAALADWFQQSPWRFALHFYVAPEFGVVTTAIGSARWRLWQVAIPEDADAPVLLGGVTDESYRCIDGVWLIAAMRFTSLQRLDPSAMPVRLERLLPVAPEED